MHWLAGLAGILFGFWAAGHVLLTNQRDLGDNLFYTVGLILVSLILLVVAARQGHRGWYWILGLDIALITLASCFTVFSRPCCMI